MSDLKWEKFTRTLEIEAVQVTAGNILDLARELGGAVKYDGDDLVYITDYGYDVPLGVYVRRDDGILDPDVWSKAVAPEPEPEPTYKEGERVEVHGWSSFWSGPATVLAQPTDTYPYYQIRTDGGREGGFTEGYLRPLEAEPEPEYKVGDRVLITGWSAYWDGPATVEVVHDGAVTVKTDWLKRVGDDWVRREGYFELEYVQPRVTGPGDFKVGERVRQVPFAWPEADRMISLVYDVVGTVVEPSHSHGVAVEFDNGVRYSAYDAWQLERAE